MEGQETKRNGPPNERTNERIHRVVSGDKSAEIRVSFSSSSFLLRGSVPRLITQRHSAYPTNNLS